MSERFLAVKINYDPRDYLKTHLKYSLPHTKQDHDFFIASFENEGIGGYGFHESINFQITEADSIKIYLPPGYVPSQNTVDNGNFTIFSFTYYTDPVLPSHIIGVHGLCELLFPKGKKRVDVVPIEEVGPFTYHAEAKTDYSTLFCVPVKYDVTEGRHIRPLERWGKGLRYIKSEEYVRNILNDAVDLAKKEYSKASKSLKIAIDRQFEIIERLKQHYFITGAGKRRKKKTVGRDSRNIVLPDKELGEIGEKFVYEFECKQAQKNGIKRGQIEWTSKIQPYSPFDIKTVRKIKGKNKVYYLEVKSTSQENYSNIHISSNQIEYAGNNSKSYLFVFLIFGNDMSSPRMQEFTLEELEKRFDFIPQKYKISEKV